MIGEMLWIENGDGAAVAHRGIVRGRPHLVSFDGRKQRAVLFRPVGRFLDTVVPVTHLTEAAPLSEAEEREYQRLDSELARTVGDSRKLRRFNALRLRSLIFTEGRQA